MLNSLLIILAKFVKLLGIDKIQSISSFDNYLVPSLLQGCVLGESNGVWSIKMFQAHHIPFF